jgi:hypothetical protein
VEIFNAPAGSRAADTFTACAMRQKVYYSASRKLKTGMAQAKACGYQKLETRNFYVLQSTLLPILSLLRRGAGEAPHQ